MARWSTSTGATLTGGNITLTANSTLFSNLANPPGTSLLASLANVSAEVVATGNASITASGSFTATAISTVNSIVNVNAPRARRPDIGRATPAINNTARSHLSGNTSPRAGDVVNPGVVNISATTTTNVNTLVNE